MVEKSMRGSANPGGCRVRIRLAAPLAWTILILQAFHASPGDCSAPVVSARTHDEMSRELIDPCLGSHWQLHIDPEHPAWPGRLVLVNASAGRKASSAGRTELGGYGFDPIKTHPGAVANLFPTLALQEAVHAGDRLVVEQDSPVLHAEFRAVALESARVGEEMRVRLTAGSTVPLSIQGRIVHVIATGSGRARWTFEEAVKP
jgi:hypothetical protein